MGIRDAWQNFRRNLRGEASLGRVVTTEDVMIHGKPGHRACQGTGAIVTRYGMTSIATPCTCAAATFQRENLDKIEPVGNGRVFRFVVGRGGAVARFKAIGIVLAVSVGVALILVGAVLL